MSDAPPSSGRPSRRSATVRAQTTFAWHEKGMRLLANAVALLQQLVRRNLPNESQHLFALTIAVGAACGFVAVAFHLAIQLAESLLIHRALSADGSSWIFWTIVSPTIGGMFAGAALTWLVPGARGSGIPQVKQAFAVEGGRIRFRDALGKFFIGSFQIGSGASLGREGPTVQICAGAASLLARATSLPPRNMRRLTPVGVAAGIAAAFNAPIAAVTFTIEEVVGSLDHTVLSGVVVAAAIAAVIERGILGVHPVIQVSQAYGLDHPSSLLVYALLGVAAAFISVLFTDGLLKLRLLFRQLKMIPPWLHPAIGGLVAGILAVVVMYFFGVTGVNGGGYSTLSKALAGSLGFKLMLALCAVKLIATIFSYSSGGAGGIFAPALFVGAMLGGAVGFIDISVFDHDANTVGAFALVGMGAVFAGVIRAPITSILIIFEMTGGYGLVLPLMLANMTAYILARRWRPVPIYEALLSQDGVELPHAPQRAHALEQLVVADAMTTELISIREDDSIQRAKELFAQHGFSTIPVLDNFGRLMGKLNRGHIESYPTSTITPLSDLVEIAHAITSDAALLRAIVRMNDLSERQLYVTHGAQSEVLVGILTMSDVVRTHAKSAPTKRLDQLTGAFPDLRLSELSHAAPEVANSMRISDLSKLLFERNSRVAIVTESHPMKVIFAEQCESLSADTELQKMLIVDDLALAVPRLHDTCTAFMLAQTLQHTGASAAIVSRETDHAILGVVTRTDLSLALLNWYTSRPFAVADDASETTHKA